MRLQKPAEPPSPQPLIDPEPEQLPLRQANGEGMDQLMLAMDVVDTLRHQQDLVEHALAEDERDAALVARIRSIYASQGIEVTDAVVREGVEALKRDRFLYQPPAAGWQLRLARVYVDRARWARRALVVGGLVLAGWLAFAVPERLEQRQIAAAAQVEVAALRGELADADERHLRLRAALQASPTPAASAAAVRLRAGIEAELDRADQALARARAAAPAALAAADASPGADSAPALQPLRAPLAEAGEALDRADTGLVDLGDLGRLAAELQRARELLAGIALSPAAGTEIDALDQQARQALSAGDLALARGRVDRLATVVETVDQAYELRIVSRPDARSGVWRHPADNPRARNYYVIVDAVAADGRPVLLPITSEEDQSQRRVSTFGVRVPERVYEAVRADKQDNGLIDNPLFAVKRRGELAPDYRMAVAGGHITDW